MPKAVDASISRIRSVVRRSETILRFGGDGGWAPITWTTDDRQLANVGDGAGFASQTMKHAYYSSRLFRVEGDPQTARFEDVPGYPEIPIWDLFEGKPPYYGMGSGMLAIDDNIYIYLSTWSRLVTAEGLEKMDVSGAHFSGAKLIYSPDNGATWHNQNGSAPVMLESFEQHSPETLVFFEESQHAFSQLSMLQMGRGYRDNRDGYVYVYSPNGITDGTMNELVMFRVSKASVLNRNSYEFFAGVGQDGEPCWVPDIEARVPVHTFPRGWVSPSFPISWLPSVMYNSALGLYMMAASGGLGGDLKETPSYQGIWVATHPWGPWHQILEEVTSATDRADPISRARMQFGIFAPKWLADDGKSFWLVGYDSYQSTAENVFGPMYHARNEQEFNAVRSRWGKFHPYFGFNTLRFDLEVR